MSEIKDEKILTAVPKDMEIVKPVSTDSLSSDQRKKWLINVFKFTALPMVAFITAVSTKHTVGDAFLFALLPALGNSILDLYTKLNSDAPYLREK